MDDELDKVQGTGDGPSADPPEDVAVLYTWANLHGGRYRDFSASRREYRAQQRHRAMEALRDAEIESASETAVGTAQDAELIEPVSAAGVEAEVQATADPRMARRHTESAEQLRAALEKARETGRRMQESRLDVPRAGEETVEEVTARPGESLRELAARAAEAEWRWREQRNEIEFIPRGAAQPFPALESEGERDGRQSPTQGRREAADADAEQGDPRVYRLRGQSVPAGEREEMAEPEPAAEERPRRNTPTLFVAESVRSQEWKRRRDSAADTTARTERRPRTMEHSAASFEFGAAPVTGVFGVARRGGEPVNKAKAGLAGIDAQRRESAGANGTSLSPEWLQTEASRNGYPADRGEALPVEYGADVPVETSPEDAGDHSPAAQGFGGEEALFEDWGAEPQALANEPEFAAAALEPQEGVTAARDNAAQLRSEAEERRADADRKLAEIKMRAVSRRMADERREREERRRQDERRAGTERRVAEAEVATDRRHGGERRDSEPSRRQDGDRRVELVQAGEREGAPEENPYEAQVARLVADAERRSAERRAALDRRGDGAELQPEMDSLQQSRERMAARRFALRDVMDAPQDEAEDSPPQAKRSTELEKPVLAVVSLSGGVGKTSLVAGIGRVLSAAGEPVLLADTSAFGLLPFYFGAREMRPGAVRTFIPPEGSMDAEVKVANYDSKAAGTNGAARTALANKLIADASAATTVLLDLDAASVWLAREFAGPNTRVLVPITPDMNSVLTIRKVERFFTHPAEGEGLAVVPFYVLNQFDDSQGLHLDVREALRRHLGDRLLKLVIRRSPAVAEALADGMTVIDYAPESPVTADLRQLAAWMKEPAIGWSER